MEDKFINQIYIKDKDELTPEEFSTLTVDFLGFNKMFNGVLFKKIDAENKGKIRKEIFLK